MNSSTLSLSIAAKPRFDLSAELVHTPKSMLLAWLVCGALLTVTGCNTAPPKFLKAEPFVRPLQTWSDPSVWMNDIEFAPDDKTLIIGASRRNKICEVRFLNLESGSQVSSFKSYNSEQGGVAISPDGRLLATSGIDRTGPPEVRLWDMGTFERKGAIKTDYATTSLTFSPDGTRLGIGTAKSIILWDVKGQKLLSQFKVKTSWHPMFAPDLSKVATVGLGGKGRVWDVSSGRVIADMLNYVGLLCEGALDVSPDGKLIAQSGGGREIRLWNIATQKITATLEGSSYNAITRIKFSPDGMSLCVTTEWTPGTGGGAAYVWKLDGSKKPVMLTEIYGVYPEVKFSRDGRRVAVADAGQVWVWDMEEVGRNSGK